MSTIKNTLYEGDVVEEKNTIWGDVVMFLLNKTIKNVGLAHGFKTISHVRCFKTMHMVYGFKTVCRAS